MYARLSGGGPEQVLHGGEARIRVLHVLPHGQGYDPVELAQGVVVLLADVVDPQVEAVAQELVPLWVRADVQPHDLAAVVPPQDVAQVSPAAPHLQDAHPALEVEVLVDLREASG